MLSAILASITSFILTSAFFYIESQSARVTDLVEILASFVIVPSVLLVLGYSLLILLYLYLFFIYERHLYVQHLLSKLTTEIEHIAQGNFNQKVKIEDNRVLGRLGTQINDIIAKAETAIDEQRKSAQLKNDLITNVAHDLRSPLTSIVGYLDLINDDQYRSEVELRYYIQIIQQKSHNLHQLMNDLFEYTLVQNKETLLHEMPINIEEMLNQLAVQFQVQTNEAGMELRQTLLTNKSPIVKGDGSKLARVFENLIQNAIRYGKDGKYIDLILKTSNDFVEIEVSNYGKVIPSNELPYIFERFYRVEKSRSSYTGGSGLGLAIVKSIIDLHGGQIEVESTVKRTSFIIKLPITY